MASMKSPIALRRTDSLQPKGPDTQPTSRPPVEARVGRCWYDHELRTTSAETPRRPAVAQLPRGTNVGHRADGVWRSTVRRARAASRGSSQAGTRRVRTARDTSGPAGD